MKEQLSYVLIIDIFYEFFYLKSFNEFSFGDIFFFLPFFSLLLLIRIDSQKLFK